MIKDIEIYQNEKEYVDTAVIPLIPISFGPDMAQSASFSENAVFLSTLLEKQLTGRILLLPAFSYVKTEKTEKLIKELHSWSLAVKSHKNIKYIFFLTSDPEWNDYEEKLGESLIFTPVLIDKQNENFKGKVENDHRVNQIMELFSQKWMEEGRKTTADPMIDTMKD